MKKGFTMIELLAVIIILGVLALIIVPVALKMINNARKDSAVISAKKYVEQVRKDLVSNSRKISVNDVTCLIYESSEGKSAVCSGDTLEVNAEGKKPVCGKITFENYKLKSYIVNIMGYRITKTGPKDEEQVEKVEGCGIEELEDTNVVDENNNNNNQNNNNQNNNNNNTNNQNLTNTTDNYIGYYADVDSDGTVDGVIYADLAHSKSGDFCNKDNNCGQGAGTYSYEAKNNLKEYTISENTYKANEGFGTNKIISLKSGSTGNSRFYVMSLNDFREEVYQDKWYYWYKNAYGKMSTWQTDTSVNFGTGKENTRQMIEKWNASGYGEQNKRDIWKHIQSKYQEGWYIPSRGEWGAFADYLANKSENPLTNDYDSNGNYTGNGNYDDIYGLSSWYWSSSQFNTYTAWYIGFYLGSMNNASVDYGGFVRLSATF